jgi:hypothetical protein
MKGARIRVYQAVAFPVPILAYPADAPLPPGNVALLGAQLATDLSSTQGGEIGGELCLDEAFPGQLCPSGFRKTEDGTGGKPAHARPAKLQELPLGQLARGIDKAFTHETGGFLSKLFNSNNYYQKGGERARWSPFRATAILVGYYHEGSTRAHRRP